MQYGQTGGITVTKHRFDPTIEKVQLKAVFPYRMRPKRRETETAESKSMLKEGIGEQASAEYVLLIPLLLEGDQTITVCFNHSLLNAGTIRYRYPTTRIDGFSNSLADDMLSSTIRANGRYYKFGWTRGTNENNAFFDAAWTSCVFKNVILLGNFPHDLLKGLDFVLTSVRWQTTFV